MKTDYDEAVIFCAFRYALGRKTYVVSEVVEFIIFNWGLISNRVQILFQEEIRKAIRENQAGMDMDVKQWQKVLTLEISQK